MEISLIGREKPYIAIVTALGRKKAGMTREEIVDAGGATGNNGNLTACLENLERSGFVRRYSAVGRAKRGSVYQLIDNYTLFYFKFAKDQDGSDEMFWSHSSASPARRAWEGLAFERVCLEHVGKIKQALGISGVASSVSSWRSIGDGDTRQGAQVDLVISRCGGEQWQGPAVHEKTTAPPSTSARMGCARSSEPWSSAWPRASTTRALTTRLTGRAP